MIIFDGMELIGIGLFLLIMFGRCIVAIVQDKRTKRKK